MRKMKKKKKMFALFMHKFVQWDIWKHKYYIKEEINPLNELFWQNQVSKVCENVPFEIKRKK